MCAERECRHLRKQVRHYRRMAEDFRRERDALRRSWSWVVTAPLRGVLRPWLGRGVGEAGRKPAGVRVEEEPMPRRLGYDEGVRVSIAIPVHNGAAYLGETLRSVLSQTHAAVEVVVVDDVSVDGSVGIAEEFARRDGRVRVLRNRERLGMTGNWNLAVRECVGEWILLMGQDDLLDADAIEVALGARREGVRLVLASRGFAFEDDASEALRESYDWELPTLDRMGVPPGLVRPGVIAELIPLLPTPCTNFIGEPLCGLVRRDVFETHGGYHGGLGQLSDYEFWLRFALREPMVYLHEKLVTFRVHGASATGTNHRDPVRGVHLESAKLLLECLVGEAYAEARGRYPELCEVWEQQLKVDVSSLQEFARRDVRAAAVIEEARAADPELDRRMGPGVRVGVGKRRLGGWLRRLSRSDARTVLRVLGRWRERA